MSDAQTSPQDGETKPGPANPSAEGVDAATPPGGPLRQDGPARGVPEGHHDDASGSRAANRDADDAGGGTIPLEDEQPDAGQQGEHPRQERNAETSLDQPSEG